MCLQFVYPYLRGVCLNRTSKGIETQGRGFAPGGQNPSLGNYVFLVTECCVPVVTDFSVVLFTDNTGACVTITSVCLSPFGLTKGAWPLRFERIPSGFSRRVRHLCTIYISYRAYATKSRIEHC